MAGSSTDVTIGSENFSIVTIPEASSQLVENEKKNLLGSLDLATLVADLGKLGNFIRVAYNGVAGNPDLQIKVQRVGYKIAELANKTAVTVDNFKDTSRDVLEKLQRAHQYLLDGFEEMALETLSPFSSVAEQMAKAAEELHNKFEAVTKDVIDALEDTQKAKGVEQERKVQMKKEQEEFDLKRKQLEELQKQAMEAEKKAEQYYADAQKREDKAFESQNSIFNKLTDALGKVLKAGVLVATLNLEKAIEKLNGDEMVYKEIIDKANKEKMKHLEDMQKQRDIRRDAIQQCIEFTERIKNCKDDESLAAVAIDALHNSVGALKSLSIIMMDAALFWRKTQKHCEALTKEDMKSEIEKAMQYPQEKRLKVWTSKGFQAGAAQYYGKWVALKDLCGSYMEHIETTRADLYVSLKENPTVEQSLENVHKLAETFEDSLEQA